MYEVADSTNEALAHLAHDLGINKFLEISHAGLLGLAGLWDLILDPK